MKYSIWQYLYRLYYDTRYVGLWSAFSRVQRKLAPPKHSNLPTEKHSSFGEDAHPLRQLGTRGAPDRRLVLIISDTQIEQCILYRIAQKRLHLGALSIPSVVIHSAHRSLWTSYLPLARAIIIYRTHLRLEDISELQSAKVPLYFEIDDLIVGADAVVASGILPSLTKPQRQSLLSEAAAFRDTANHVDEWIVSTEVLKHSYQQEMEAGRLRVKKINVINNFLVQKKLSTNETKRYTFAYTSPSLSVGPELSMAKEALLSYAALNNSPFEILVLGNRKAYDLLSSLHADIHVTLEPFNEYGTYIRLLSQAEFTIIPLSNTKFNDAKTAIRAMDCALSHSLPLVSHVGEYRKLSENTNLSPLIVLEDDWAAAGARIPDLKRRYEELFREFSLYIENMYGASAAARQYKSVFSF